MTHEHAPEGYGTVTPYMVVASPERFLAFCEAVLDATVMERIPDGDGNITHSELRIGESLVMAGRAGAERDPVPALLYVYVADADATYARALAHGGTSTQEPSDQAYGDRVAGVKGPEGISWWFATRKETLSPEEIARRSKGGKPS